ncbi:MAG: glycosyltransferase family 2 protein [Cytophagaceae bacterium]|nr:glycosyltransferase family 2 protein [Gemmatimonadaceae bacterium]
MSRRPDCSIIVPAKNAAGMLPRTLGAICGSDLSRDHWELIVVDDGSTDETAAVAARYADTVIKLPGKSMGPAYARNRGFEVSRGDIAMFFDADVVVHQDTLRRFLEVMRLEPEAGAVFGSYDDRPAAQGFVSQYRNLLHHHVHQQNGGDVETFWAGAGAVRREVFEEAGMYDEWHYSRPQIEDIEMGGRIRRLGHRILLRPEIQATHLKRWTLAGVLKTDLTDRGIPWARLLAHRGTMLSSGTLNLRWTEKLNTILVWLGTLSLLASLPLLDWRPAIAGGVCLVAAVLFSMPLLGFFARARGVWFAMRVIPVHLLYYLLNGISFGLGMMLHELIGAPRQDPTIEAYSEIGVKRWPPVPTRNRSTWTADKENHA